MEATIGQRLGKTYYYITPRGKGTNENIMRELARYCDATDDKVTQIKVCGHFKKEEVVEVTLSTIKKLKAHLEEFNLRFSVFKKKEGKECATELKFPVRKKIHRTSKFKKVKDWVSKLPKKK